MSGEYGEDGARSLRLLRAPEGERAADGGPEGGGALGGEGPEAPGEDAGGEGEGPGGEGGEVELVDEGAVQLQVEEVDEERGAGDEVDRARGEARQRHAGGEPEEAGDEGDAEAVGEAEEGGRGGGVEGGEAHQRPFPAADGEGAERPKREGGEMRGGAVAPVAHRVDALGEDLGLDQDREEEAAGEAEAGGGERRGEGRAADAGEAQHEDERGVG